MLITGELMACTPGREHLAMGRAMVQLCGQGPGPCVVLMAAPALEGNDPSSSAGTMGPLKDVCWWDLVASALLHC